MGIVLYDLAGANDDFRFSPYCWRVRLALAHKKLEAESIPWRFTEKERIAFSGQGLVPVLVDGDKVISDSWKIACYLESAYPDRPSLFGSIDCHTQAYFLKCWCELTLQPLIMRLIVSDLFSLIHDKDKDYFRQSREARYGLSLEEVSIAAKQCIPMLRETLAPLRTTLQHQRYLGGTVPGFVDYMVFGHFQMANMVSHLSFLEIDDPIYVWHRQLLQAFDVSTSLR